MKKTPGLPESEVEAALTIAQLEAENAVYAAERERLCAPVSDEEFEHYHGHDVRGIGMFDRCDVNLLIRQRTAAITAPAQEAQKEKE